MSINLESLRSDTCLFIYFFEKYLEIRNDDLSAIKIESDKTSDEIDGWFHSLPLFDRTVIQMVLDLYLNDSKLSSISDVTKPFFERMKIYGTVSNSSNLTLNTLTKDVMQKINRSTKNNTNLVLLFLFSILSNVQLTTEDKIIELGTVFLSVYALTGRIWDIYNGGIGNFKNLLNSLRSNIYPVPLNYLSLLYFISESVFNRFMDVNGILRPESCNNATDYVACVWNNMVRSRLISDKYDISEVIILNDVDITLDSVQQSNVDIFTILGEKQLSPVEPKKFISDIRQIPIKHETKTKLIYKDFTSTTQVYDFKLESLLNQQTTDMKKLASAINYRAYISVNDIIIHPYVLLKNKFNEIENSILYNSEFRKKLYVKFKDNDAENALQIISVYYMFHVTIKNIRAEYNGYIDFLEKNYYDTIVMNDRLKTYENSFENYILISIGYTRKFGYFNRYGIDWEFNSSDELTIDTDELNEVKSILITNENKTFVVLPNKLTGDLLSKYYYMLYLNKYKNLSKAPIGFRESIWYVWSIIPTVAKKVGITGDFNNCSNSDKCKLETACLSKGVLDFYGVSDQTLINAHATLTNLNTIKYRSRPELEMLIKRLSNEICK